MINKKMIPGIIIFVILIVIIIVIIHNCNKKNKENEDKLQQCNQEVQKCKTPLKDTQLTVNSLKQQLQKSLNDKEMVISNLEKQNKFKLAKTKHFAKKYGETYEKTINLLKSSNAIVPAGKSRRRLGGVSNEALEEMLSELKADNHTNEAAEQCGQIGDATVDLISAIYEGAQDGFTEQSKEEIVKSVGVGLINIFFACSGLGFLTGPFTKFVSIFTGEKGGTTENTGEQIASQLLGDINTLLQDNQLATYITNVNSYLNQIADSFLITGYNYYNKYSNSRVLCPDPLCGSSQNPCDIASCMNKNTNISKSVDIYDPSAVTMMNNGSINRRQYILNTQNQNQGVSTGLSSSPLSLLFSNNYNDGISPTGILNLIYTNYNTSNRNGCFYTMISGYPLYVNIIQYNIIYLQEQSLYNISTDNNNNYLSPYSSLKSNPIYSGVESLSNPSASPLNQMNQSPCLLQQFYNYIQNIFTLYIQNCLAIKTQTDNGKCCNSCGVKHAMYCCGDNYCDDCFYCVRGGTFVTDSCSLLNTVPTNGKVKSTWYQLISQKYNDKLYGNNIFGPTQSDNTAYITKYLTYFNEFMNFPLDVYLIYMQMCGNTLTNATTNLPATSADLFNNMIYYIYTNINKAGGINGLSTLTVPSQITINIVFDPSSAYPFGLNRPSFGEYTKNNGCGATSSPQAFFECLDNYNTYCTSPYAISPGNSFDASLFNLPGDNHLGNLSSNSICSDPTANIVKSCGMGLQGMITNQANMTSQANNYSRMAYCMNSLTGEYSTIISQGGTPAPNTTPTTPSSGTKCWDIPNQNIDITKNPSAIIQLQLGSGGWTNSVFSGLYNITWNGNMMTCGIASSSATNDTTITFDNYQNITNLTGPYLGPQSPSTPIPYYIVNDNVNTYPTNGYKCWDLFGDGSSIFRVDSSGTYTYNGIAPSYLGHETTTVIFTAAPGSNHTNFSLIFGANESIIDGKVDGSYLFEYFNYSNTTTPPPSSKTKINIQPYIATNLTFAPPNMRKKWVLQTNSDISCILIDSNGVLDQCFEGAGTYGQITNYTNGLLTINYASKFNQTIDSFVVFGENESIVYGKYAGNTLINLPYLYEITSF